MSWLIWKDPDAGKDWGQQEKGTRGWDSWMASPTQWTWVWVNSGSWWWTGRPGMLWFMGSQRVRQDWATELNWFFCHLCICTHTYTQTYPHSANSVSLGNSHNLLSASLHASLLISSHWNISKLQQYQLMWAFPSVYCSIITYYLGILFHPQFSLSDRVVLRG